MDGAHDENHSQRRAYALLPSDEGREPMTDPDDVFDLRALVREVAESSAAADPVVLAAEVERRIPAKQRRDALMQALPQFVMTNVSRKRSTITPGGYASHERHGAVAVGAVPSRKVASIRDSWRKSLRDRIAVGDGDWKFLGDCTVADLGYAASVREAHARQNADRAAQYRELAQRMERAGVDTVAELTDADLGDALGAAA